jgi:hypothetical protein
MHFQVPNLKTWGPLFTPGLAILFLHRFDLTMMELWVDRIRSLERRGAAETKKWITNSYLAKDPGIRTTPCLWRRRSSSCDAFHDGFVLSLVTSTESQE